MSRRDHYKLNDRFYGSAAVKKVKNEFPSFSEGDVVIAICSKRSYKLHAEILRCSSELFAKLLDKSDAVQLNKHAERKGTTIRYRLTLVENEDAAHYPSGSHEPATHVLKRMKLDDFSNAFSAITPLEDAGESKYMLAWEKVLGAFYNRPIDIGEDNSDDINFTLELAMEVLKIAEYLQCIPLISIPVSSTLLSLNQTLYRSIAANPAPWLDLAYRIKSRKIFGEALIHGSGAYNTPAIQRAIQPFNLTPSVTALLAQKASLLQNLSRRIQSTLITWYPEQLQRAKTVGRTERDSIGRTSYDNDILTWMALCVFRHWISQMICSDKTHHSEDMGFAFFSLIAEGDDAYLDRAVINAFQDYSPMIQKGEAMLENRVSEIKGYARESVRDALRNCSMLDVERYPAGHMTCLPVGDEDFPWERSQGGGDVTEGDSTVATYGGTEAMDEE